MKKNLIYSSIAAFMVVLLLMINRPECMVQYLNPWQYFFGCNLSYAIYYLIGFVTAFLIVYSLLRHKMIKESLQIAVVPSIIIIYGWYLGQQQSMQDLAGILMLMTGVAGWTLGFAGHIFTRRRWNRWYVNVVLGILGCVLVFVALAIYARVNG